MTSPISQSTPGFGTANAVVDQTRADGPTGLVVGGWRTSFERYEKPKDQTVNYVRAHASSPTYKRQIPTIPVSTTLDAKLSTTSNASSSSDRHMSEAPLQTSRDALGKNRRKGL